MLRKIILPVAILALLALAPLTVQAASVGTGTDPALTGCYVYGPGQSSAGVPVGLQVNEGETFTATIKCHGLGTVSAYGFQFKTVFTPTPVTVNGVASQPVAVQVATSGFNVYTAGNFAPTNPLEAINDLNGYYAVSHEGTDVSNADFTLGTFDATVPFGITANSSATVDLSSLKLSDRSGVDIAVALPQSSVTVAITNLVIPLLNGTVRVQSDGAMTNLTNVVLDLGGLPAPISHPSVLGSSHSDFVLSSYQYATTTTHKIATVSMQSHLSCTQDITLADGPNAATLLGTSGTVTLKAGDANSDSSISIDDATLVGGYIGTTTTITPAADVSDINGDGNVNIYDLVAIGRNYNAASTTCS